MKNIKEKVKKLRELLNDELDETKIVSIGEPLIADLRECWRQDSGKFSTSDITSLKEMSAQLTAVSDFIVEKMDFDYIKTQEDVDEAMSNLNDIVQATKGLPIANKVATEIRALAEKKNNLPISTQVHKNAQLKTAIHQLNANAPRCVRKKCRATMVIRQSEIGYFWGCSAFPNCWHKQRLTAAELAALPE